MVRRAHSETNSGLMEDKKQKGLTTEITQQKVAAAIHTEMNQAIHTEMNQTDLAFDEIQPPLSSQTRDLSSNYKQKHVEDEVTIDIKENFQGYRDDLLLQECCVYRVPITLRRHLKDEAYTPKVISIGPFHYGNGRLQDMERYKQILFKRFTQRAMSSLDDLVCFIRHMEPKIRASYSETINLTEEELVKLTLMDASFIIELFIMYYGNDELLKNGKLSRPWLQEAIRFDLLLFENQLPFFVIKELFNKAFPHDRCGSHPSILRLTYEYFGCFNLKNLQPTSNVKIKHFTDLLRLFHMQGKVSQCRHSFSEVARHILLYNVNELQEAGIKLKASNSGCSLDLKFSGHVLEIPKIRVDVYTELFWGNMIALEQCHYPNDACIADYALLFNWLIDTSKDVDLLVHNKIFENHLGDTNNVASLFNGLSEHVVHSTFSSEYLDICRNLNGYCQDPLHEMKATLRRDYCRTPWQTVASIAGIVILFLTVFQTILSVLQVVK